MVNIHYGWRNTRTSRSTHNSIHIQNSDEVSVASIHYLEWASIISILLFLWRAILNYQLPVRSRSVFSNSLELGARKYGYSRWNHVEILYGSKDLKTSVIIWLPSRINKFRLGRAVLAVMPLSWDLENVSIAVEITLLSIAEADKLWGCQVVNWVCAIKDTSKFQWS